jgi:hypothetical protein
MHEIRIWWSRTQSPTARLPVGEPAQQFDALAQRCPLRCVEIVGDGPGEPAGVLGSSPAGRPPPPTRTSPKRASSMRIFALRQRRNTASWTPANDRTIHFARPAQATYPF